MHSNDDQLDKLVDGHLCKKKDLSDDEKCQLKSVIISGIKEKIINDYKPVIVREIEEQYKNKVIEDKIDNANEFGFIVVMVGFFVGMLVNQVTEFVTWIIEEAQIPAFYIRMAVVILLLYGIYFIYNHIYLDTIKKYANRRNK